MHKLFLYSALCLGLQGTAQTYNCYFGNIHAHSGYSDGNKDSSTTGKNKPSDDFAFAKLSQHFDFLGISEHNHHSGSDLAMTPSRYQMGLQQTAAANADGSFVCLYGMEYGVITSGGHIITYGFNQLIGWESGNYDIYNAKLDYDGYFRKVAHKAGAFAYLAHPDDPANPFPVGGTGTSLTSQAYNATYDTAIVGVPLRSGPAFSTFTDYSDMDGSDYTPYYNQLLAKGYHLGMGYDHDTHYLTFGRHTPGRLVVLAQSLTQANIMDGLMNMRFYGSDDWNAKIDFTINSNVMGSIVQQAVAPQISLIHSDGDGELAKTIKLYSGVPGSGSAPTVLNSITNGNTMLYTDATLAPGSTKYYYFRITQPDGDVIETSPIWYTYINLAGIQTYDAPQVWTMYPNPATGTVYLSADIQGAYTVQIVDVSGRLVFNESYGTSSATLDISALSKGFYTVKLLKDNTAYSRKLVVE